MLITKNLHELGVTGKTLEDPISTIVLLWDDVSLHSSYSKIQRGEGGRLKC